jgi:hypothetical protein
MSEPYSAFVKLQMERADLVAWLEDPPPLTSSWTDWREMGGEYYFKGGRRDIAVVSDVELNRDLADCDAQLRGYLSNRTALRGLLNSNDEPYLTRIAFDSSRREFVAGSLSYSENLFDYFVFLTIARGAGARLRPDGYGVAVIHKYLYGGPNEKETGAAMRLGPGDKSQFMAASELASAAGVFQSIADEVLDAKPFPPPTRNELDLLR